MRIELAPAQATETMLMSLAVVALAGCGRPSPVVPDAPTPPEPEWAVIAGEFVPDALPYRGTVATTHSTPDPSPPPPCLLFLDTAQEGRATHLGRFTGTGATCVVSQQAPVFDPVINPAGGPPPYLVAEARIEQTYTAADGDQLVVSGTALLVQSLMDGSSGFVGGGTIDGGTGRFTGATGSFSIEGISGQTAHFEGWIVFDASASRGS